MTSPALPIARNTALLSAALATHSAMLALAAAVASITLVRVLDLEWLLGLGPVIVLTAAGVAALAIGALALLVAPAVWILRDGAAHVAASRRRS